MTPMCPTCLSTRSKSYFCTIRHPNGMHLDHDNDCISCTHGWHDAEGVTEGSMEKAVCKLCGEPMPEGEEMFNYHGYSGGCPKPPLPKKDDDDYVAFLRFRNEGDNQWIEVCDSDSDGAFKVYRRK